MSCLAQQARAGAHASFHAHTHVHVIYTHTSTFITPTRTAHKPHIIHIHCTLIYTHYFYTLPYTLFSSPSHINTNYTHIPTHHTYCTHALHTVTYIYITHTHTTPQNGSFQILVISSLSAFLNFPWYNQHPTVLHMNSFFNFLSHNLFFPLKCKYTLPG